MMGSGGARLRLRQAQPSLMAARGDASFDPSTPLRTGFAQDERRRRGRVDGRTSVRIWWQVEVAPHANRLRERPALRRRGGAAALLRPFDPSTPLRTGSAQDRLRSGHRGAADPYRRNEGAGLLAGGGGVRRAAGDAHVRGDRAVPAPRRAGVCPGGGAAAGRAVLPAPVRGGAGRPGAVQPRGGGWGYGDGLPFAEGAGGGAGGVRGGADRGAA